MRTTEHDGLYEFFANLDSCRDKTYLTHGLHPYPAKFIPHIPRRLIQAFALRGAPVLDPMCGSGTTLVEAALLGFEGVGIDLNPIAVLAARAKTVLVSPDDCSEVEALIARIREASSKTERVAQAETPTFRNREKWFTPGVLAELAYALEETGRCAPPASLLGRAAVSSIIVNVSNQESETRWCAKPTQVSPGGVLARLASRLEVALDRAVEYSAAAAASVMVSRSDARKLPLADSSMGTVVTSPPYANSHDYYLYNKLRMFLLGYEVAPVQAAEIGSRNRHSDMNAPIEHYLETISEALAEWRRVLISGGRAAVVVADAVVRGEFFDMGVRFKEIAGEVGFTVETQYAFSHRRFNSTFQRGFGTAFDKQTHVLIFR